MRRLRGATVALTLFCAPFVLGGCAANAAANARSYAGIPFATGAADAQLQALARAAQAGDKQAQFELGIRHEDGRGVPADSGRAAQLYRAAGRDSGGQLHVYSPPVGRHGQGRVVTLDTGRSRPGLAEAPQVSASSIPDEIRVISSSNSAEEIWQRLGRQLGGPEGISPGSLRSVLGISAAASRPSATGYRIAWPATGSRPGRSLIFTYRIVDCDWRRPGHSDPLCATGPRRSEVAELGLLPDVASMIRAVDAGTPIPCPSLPGLLRSLDEGGWRRVSDGQRNIWPGLFRRPGAELEIHSSILNCITLVKIYQRLGGSNG